MFVHHGAEADTGFREPVQYDGIWSVYDKVHVRLVYQSGLERPE
jgi:hypothetical protein